MKSHILNWIAFRPALHYSSLLPRQLRHEAAISDGTQFKPQVNASPFSTSTTLNYAVVSH